MPDASVYKDNLLVLDPSLNTQSCNRRPRAARAAKDAKDWSLPSFGSHLNPISTRGADYAQLSTTVLTMLKYVPAALNPVSAKVHYLSLFRVN